MKRYWPKTMAEFERLRAAAKARYAGPMGALNLHDLMGINDALEEALDAMKAEAHAEDVKNGHRPPGTLVGNR